MQIFNIKYPQPHIIKYTFADVKIFHERCSTIISVAVTVAKRRAIDLSVCLHPMGKVYASYEY